VSEGGWKLRMRFASQTTPPPWEPGGVGGGGTAISMISLRRLVHNPGYARSFPSAVRAQTITPPGLSTQGRPKAAENAELVAKYEWARPDRSQKEETPIDVGSIRPMGA
jgi:hypothetical protein